MFPYFWGGLDMFAPIVQGQRPQANTPALPMSAIADEAARHTDNRCRPITIGHVTAKNKKKFSEIPKV